jgi:hypothetical protein
MAEVIPLTRTQTRGLTVGRSRLEPTTGAPQEVYVLFTGFAETLRAIRVASQLASATRGGVTVIHFRPIGFLMPLDHPSGLSPVETDAFKARLAAEDCGVRVRVCLCRDPRVAIRSVIDRDSLVVIGGRRGWWPSPSARWRRMLEEEGYVVVLANEAGGERKLGG